MRQSQQQRILAILEAIRSGDHHIPEEYLRRHPSGDGRKSHCHGRPWAPHLLAVGAETRPIHHLFLFIGAEPNTDWLAGSGVALDGRGLC